MGLRDDGTVLIEVGVNEQATKEQNPHVAYGPDEVAAELVRVFRAGATLAHYHARHDDGTQAWVDAELSRRALDTAAREVDVLAYPSYNDGCLDHVLALADRPGAHRIQVTPFDPSQHPGIAVWDEATATMSALPGDDGQPGPATPPVLGELVARGLVPNLAVYSSADLRWVVCAARAGLLPSPVNLKIFASDRLLMMHDPDPRVLALYASLLEGVDHETVVVPYMMTSPQRCEELWRCALELGFGIRTGIGDNPEAFPSATNVELVEGAVALAAGYGLEPATPAELRARCGIEATVP